MWRIVAIMAVRATFVPTESVVYELGRLRCRERRYVVLHISSRLPDSEKSESASACFDDGLCQRWAPYLGWSQINANVYGPLPARKPCISCLTAGICSLAIQPNWTPSPSRYTATAGSLTPARTKVVGRIIARLPALPFHLSRSLGVAALRLILYCQPLTTSMDGPWLFRVGK